MGNMATVKSHFESEAQVFDEVILKLIPYYKEMVTALVSVIPFDGTDTIKVLDLGCGTGTISNEIKQKFPNAIFTIVDISGNMITIAKDKIGNADTKCHNVDFYKYTIDEKFDVVTSSLALHHLINHEDKKQFYKKIFNSLNNGGVFFNADVILGSNDFLQKKYMEKWIEYMSRRCDIDEINDKWLLNYRNEDRPAILLEQIAWLKAIGFKNIDIIWKYYNFAVYGGFK